jgi:hypothetical protein
LRRSRDLSRLIGHAVGEHHTGGVDRQAGGL